MATFGEYTSKKKKKVSFGEYTRSVLGDDVEINEIGPVKETKKKEEKKSWFKSGEFEDGYQFGDLTKTILGSGSDLLEDAGAGILGIGEKAVDSLMFAAPLITQGQYYQNGGGYNIQRDKVFEDTINQSKKANQEFIQKDLYDEKELSRKLLSNVPSAAYMSNIAQSGRFATPQDWQMSQQMQSASRKYIDNDMEKASVFGEKSDALAESGGQLLGTAGLQFLGVPWWLTTGATSFGSEVENAFNQGATYEEAGLSASITAGAEILTEKISGGIKFGGKTLDDAATKQLSRVITNKVARTLSKVGMDVVGEGGEEVLSGYLSAVGQKLTYADEKELNELFSSEDALDAFIGGAILGGVSSGGKAITETAKGNDYASGLTDSEKSVVDKVYQDAIAEQEADGKKLTQREKSELYDKTLTALEKGYIDTDTIESVVGGDTYSSLKAITEQETASKKEYDALYQMKNGEKSDAQVDRQAELKKHLEEIATRKAKLREELDGVVSGLVQGNKLSEAYNEKGRKRQVFEADLTKYDSMQAEVVKKAAESGILNNTNKTHDFVDMIAKLSAEKGVSFDFTNNQKLKESGFALDGKTVNGFVKDGSISLNIDSAKALNTVVGHEITHVLEGTALYGELQNVVREYAKTKGEYDTRFQEISKLYEGVEGANIDSELTAELIGDYVFTDSDFISKLSSEKPGVFKKIFDEIKYLYKVATAGSKEARELEKVKRTFEKVYREGGKTTTNAESTKKIQTAEARSEKSPLNQQSVDKNSVSQNSEKSSGDVKYSISDSEGRKLAPAIQKRFANSKAVNENGELKVLYHGTPSGEFTVFDKSKGSVEGDFGSGFYFTDNEADVSEHYEGGGPDFENKVARRAEQIEQDEDIDYDEAEKRAREELFVGGHKFEVYLNIENPAIVGETTLFDNESYLGEYNEEDYDDYDDYIADVEQLVADDIENIVWEVEKNVDVYNVDGLSDVLYEAYYEGGIGIEELKAKINDLYLEDNNGNMVGNEVTRQIIESLGYDGIIDPTVSHKWNMDMEEGTTHYIVFKPNQIKAITNENPTDNPDIHMSLSNRKERPVKHDFNVYGKDIALEQDIAPVSEDVQTQSVIKKEPVQDDIAPLTEDQANERDTDQIEQSYFIDEDGIPVREEPYYNADMAPDSPFDKRDYETIGNRKIKAYMYENPEVKPFFQEEAMGMLAELNNSVKGERGYNDDLYYDTNGEMGFYGVKRHTSEDIAYLLDKKLDSYADIERGLKAIIEDHGAENNATSKRIEFILDERLRSGYRDFFTGERIPPNQDYINLLTEKQITEYNDEAWDNFVRNSSEEDIQEYFGENEDIGPAVQPEKAVMEDIGPVRDDIQQTRDDVDSTSDDMPLYEQENGRLSMFEEPEAPKKVTRSVLHSNIVENIKNRFAEKGFDFDNVLRKAKDLSTLSTVDNTPQRVMEKALGYKQGQILGDLTVNQVAQNETEGTKWLDSFTNRKNGLLAQISKEYGIKPGSKKSASAQMYAEGFYVDENNDIIAYGDTELAKDFPDRRVQENIKGLARDGRIRKIYDETLKMINESRARNAYPEIPRLDNYFLHFRAMDDTFSRLGLPFNPNDIRAKDLPTDLNGVTADLKPGQPYFASAKHRTGQRTSFDLLGGLERYLSSAKNQIYHIDDIQTLRALRNYIADTYGQAHGLESLNTLSEEEAQERIKEVYGSHLSTFAKFLNEEANVLAGKTALIDRGLEGIIGRRGITFLDTLNRQVGANMVGFNISSSLTNFLSVAQTFAKSNKADFVKAFAQTTSNKISSIFGRNDGFAEQSPVMIRRKGADRFYRTPWQKAGDTGYALMGAVDSISAELIARTKYNELTRKGMDSQKAHYETDKWVSRLMGDRSLGQQPQLYNSKMLGVLTKFQLEVRNQLDSQFYDTIQEAKVSSEDIKNGLARNAKTAAKVTSTFVQLAVAQHLFGKAFESVAGYNPAFDIIGVLIKAFGFDDDEEKEDTVLDNVEQAFLELLGDLPYTSTLTGGRIPIASALPVEQFITGKDDYGNEKSRWETIKETAPYYLLPGGYSQLKKTTQGLGMFDDDLPIAGSYTDSGNLRFPVEDTLQNRVQAGVFGQWASDEARDYFDKERKPLKEKQIQELIDVDLPISEYWKYREGLSGLDSLSDKADYINSLDLPIDKKNILVNNQADRKEPIDLTGFDDRFADFEEFDFAVNNPEKYEIAKKVGGYAAYKSYKDGMKGMKLEEKADYVAGLDLTAEQKNALINGETERKEPIDLTDYDKYGDLAELDYAVKSPEKYAVSKVIGGYEKFSVYAEEIGDIRADKDSNGKTINGSAKEKKIEYINSLDLDYGQKILLYRTYFDSQADKEAYNYDIVEYLNGREDVSYEEMVKILEGLDMKVHSDGTVTW